MNVSDTELRALAAQHGTPLFVYSERYLRERATVLTELVLPYGLTPRYAMKANNHPDILRLFHEAGLHFDASSSYEAVELLELGVPGDHISLSSQQPAHNLEELLRAGVLFVTTSLHQLRLFAETAGHGAEVGLRVNPGLGAGHNNRLMTGGANSSFGLWNSYVPEALAYAKEQGIRITRLHVHVGTGADPKMWDAATETALDIAEQMPDVTSLDIGGGFKIRYYSDDQESDISAITNVFAERLREFAARTGRELNFEIEPGRWLVAHAGVLLAEVVDSVDTGPDGHRFLRLNTGMNDFIRAGMYGAQHQIDVLNDSEDTERYVIAGHCCETSDIMTPQTNDPENIEPRDMRKANIGDIVAIRDTGAYCQSMSTKGYNSFPPAPGILA